MAFRTVALALLAAIAHAAPQKRDSSWASGFDWGNEVVRGVNIGGWLVLEPWITPSIFTSLPQNLGIIDEYTLGQQLGNQAAYEQVLKPHWESWVCLADFQKIANSGFNLVRIPIGYWAYETFGEPFTQGAAPYLDRAIGWARQTGLKVIIDLHGAPLSQNGFDNSGQKRPSPGWQQGDSVAQTLQVLATIQNKYGASSYDDVIAGIELLNEPFTPSLNLDGVKSFEKQGYYQQRSASSTRVVVIQDGFQAPSSYNGWLTPSDNNAQWVALDHHEYQVFSNEQVAMVPWQHRQAVCNNAGAYDGADKWTIVGEWTGAMTDCAFALNGYGVGARYDGTYPGSSYVGSCDGVNDINSWSEDFRNDMRGYIEAQLEVFEHYTQGWVFWNFKTENSGAPEWDAFALIDAGIFPQPLTARQFGPICQF